MKAIITIGVSASGKTTWAKQFVSENMDWVIVCRDDIRTELMGGVLAWEKWDWKREKEVTRIQQARFLEAKIAKKNLIVADTNLTKVESLESYLTNLGFEVQRKEFPVSLAEAIRRDSLRQASVSAKVIEMQFQKWMEYKDSK